MAVAGSTWSGLTGGPLDLMLVPAALFARPP